MKKMASFVLLTCVASATLYAQEMASKKLNWGIKTGINVSNLCVTDGTDSDWKTGFVFGAFFRIKGSSQLSLQPEFLYSSMGGKELAGNSGSSLRLNYFSIPVLLRYRVAPSLSVIAGPQVDVLIQAKTKSSTNQFTKVTDSYKEDSFNGTAGFEFRPLPSFGVTARYIYGFNNINLTTATGMSGGATQKIKNQGIQVTAGIKL